MFLQQFNNVLNLYQEAKFWVPAITGAIAVYKGYSVVKKALTNDIPHIQSGITSLATGLTEQTKALTESQNKHSDMMRASLDKQTDILMNMALSSPKAKAARGKRKK